MRSTSNDNHHFYAYVNVHKCGSYVCTLAVTLLPTADTAMSSSFEEFAFSRRGSSLATVLRC